MQRVEGHAKGLTTTNLELRESLKTVEEEKLSWERRYMSLQAKEESLVRQIESAIQQRTESLQIHLAKGGTGALAQLMDQVIFVLSNRRPRASALADDLGQVRQHQLDLFAAQETLRVKEEELSKALSDKEILEARIASFANEMIDLRQAAGPTANLISKLKEDARNAQLNERTVREELRAMREAFKPQQKQPTLFQLNIKDVAAVSTQTAADNRAFCAQGVQTDDVHFSSANSQSEAVMMKVAIEGYKEMMQEKDQKIELQASEIKAKGELIQIYVDSSSAQLDKYQAKHVALERALEEKSAIISKLKAEIDAMEKRLKEVEANLASSKPDLDRPEALKKQDSLVLAPETELEAETQLRRLATQNQKIVQDYKHVVDQYKQERAVAEELRSEMQRQKSLTDLLSNTSGRVGTADTIEVCVHMCGRGMELLREVCGILGVREGPISPGEAAVLMQQARLIESAKPAFEKIAQALISVIKAEWSTIADVMATLQQARHEASALAKEKASISFSQLVGASRLAEVHKALAAATPAKKMPKTMQERYEEQRGRWERRKAQIQQERSACIARCLDSFMKVVEVNFKMPFTASLPSPPHSARALVYSTLLDVGHAPSGVEQSYRARVSPPPQRVVHTSVYTLPIPDVATTPDWSNRPRLNSALAERYSAHQVFSARGQTRGGDPTLQRSGAMTARLSTGLPLSEESAVALKSVDDGSGGNALWPRVSNWTGGAVRPARISSTSKSGFLSGNFDSRTGLGQAVNNARVYVPLAGTSSSAGSGLRGRTEAQVPATARPPDRIDADPNPRRGRWSLRDRPVGGLGSKAGREQGARDGGQEEVGLNVKEKSVQAGVHVVKLLPFLL